MNAHRPAPKKVVIAIRMAGVPGRRKFAGVFRYLEEHHEQWDIRFVRTQEYFTKQFVKSIVESGVDGVIASFPEAHEANLALERSGIPMVILDPRDSGLFPNWRRAVAWLRSDGEAMGRAAAEHLAAQGRFKSYGYVHDRSKSAWSDERAAAFSEAVGGCQVFFAKNRSPDHDIEALSKWLSALPRPAAVMVAYDDRAIAVMEACRRAELSIPKDVAVVSCDNDELLCNNLSPGLTSVEADFYGIGYRAGELLARMLRGDDVSASEVCGGVRLVARASSAPASCGGPLVNRALAFIKGNAVKGICVQDVADHLRVSRRLADLRFREVCGKSISEAIRDRKIEAVKELLLRTDYKIEAIAASCGFPDTKNLMTLFRKTEGCTMGKWRGRSRREVSL